MDIWGGFLEVGRNSRKENRCGIEHFASKHFIYILIILSRQAILIINLSHLWVRILIYHKYLLVIHPHEIRGEISGEPSTMMKIRAAIVVWYPWAMTIYT